MVNLEQNVLSAKLSTDDELAIDDLEQVNGGALPALAIAGIAIGTVAAGTFVLGAVKGAMAEETAEADRHRGRCG